MSRLPFTSHRHDPKSNTPQEITMMRIKTDDHTYIEGTAKEIIAALNETSLAAHAKTAKLFMEESADRATMITGTDVRFDSPEHYLNDLAKAGLIEICEDGK